MKALYRRSLAAIIAAGMILAVLWKAGIYFETNDDRYIASILSGVITSEPDAHVLYVNYLLTFPLSLLYRLTTAVPWYGGMLILFQWLAYYNILDSAYIRCRNTFQIIAVTAMTFSFFMAYCYMLGLIQYTSTAALLAMSGYVCLILNTGDRKRTVMFGVLELAAFLLRDDAMLMIQPLGLAAVSGLFLGRRTLAWKEKLAKSGEILLVLAAVLLTGLAGNVIGGRCSREWKQYEQFNDTRTALFDYYGKPEYEEVQEILDRYNISEEQYKAYCSYVILNWNAGTQCDIDLKEYVLENNKNTAHMTDILREFCVYFTEDYDWKINRVAIAAWVMWLAFALIGHRTETLFSGIGLAMAEAAVWGALVRMGRMPHRIVIPLFACETILLMAVCLNEYVHLRRRKLWGIVLLVTCLLFCYLGLGSSKLQYRYIREMNEGQKIYIEGLEEIQEYCDEHPDNRYLIEAETLAFYKGSALETRIYHPANNVISGGWFSNSPNVQRHLEEYLNSGETGFYFIIYADGSQENKPAMQYLSKEMNEKPVLTDEFAASHGGIYAVYYFEGRFPFE